MKLLQMYAGKIAQYVITKENLVGMEMVQQFDIPCMYTWLYAEEIVPMLRGTHKLSYCTHWEWKRLYNKHFEQYTEVLEFDDLNDLLDKVPEMFL